MLKKYIQEVEEVYFLFLLHEQQVEEEVELHVVVQALEANDYMGQAN